MRSATAGALEATAAAYGGVADAAYLDASSRAALRSEQAGTLARLGAARAAYASGADASGGDGGVGGSGGPSGL